MNTILANAPKVVSSAMILTATAQLVNSALALPVCDASPSQSSYVLPIDAITNTVLRMPDLPQAPMPVWLAVFSQRFQLLSRKEARGEITIQELAELNGLARLRKISKFPRTADEILWHRKQQSVTQKLFQALKEYAAFHDGPGPAEKS